MPDGKRRILVVDDSPEIVEMIVDHFDGQGYDVCSAGTGKGALAQLSRGFGGVVLLDFKLPDVDGLELLDRIPAVAPDSSIIMVTAHGSVGMAVEAVQNRGAFYVHSKGEDKFLERLSGSVANAFGHLELVRKLRSLESSLGSRFDFANIVTQSRQMQAIFRTLENVVESKVTVLVMGESGTGKELIAKAIHYNGPRRSQPFVAINCAGIPDTLLESELFGYEKGAFTGAYSRKKGKFEAANKGTLFLDEIGEMNLSLQAKILRILQEKSFERLGGNELVNVDVRIISATNKKLEEEVAAGRFREDLYYRLSVFPVLLPPLRDRRNDIDILAEHFLKKFAEEEGKSIEGFTQRALEVLGAFHYPGNVRQLENIVSHSAVVCSSNRIDICDLPPYLRGPPIHESPSLGSISSESAVPNFDLDGIIPLKELEEIAIERAVLACKGNVSRAARLLGVSRATIYRKTNGPGRQGGEKE